jgi:hypothetical protein
MLSANFVAGNGRCISSVAALAVFLYTWRLGRFFTTRASSGNEASRMLTACAALR